MKETFTPSGSAFAHAPSNFVQRGFALQFNQTQGASK
jgi:hypothetical protein